MASNTRKGLIRILILFLTPLLRAITPTLKVELEKFLLKFYAKAMSTENPLDDMLAGFLLNIFDIDEPDEE